MRFGHIGRQGLDTARYADIFSVSKNLPSDAKQKWEECLVSGRHRKVLPIAFLSV